MTGPEDLEALRRRVYGPDAREGDLDRYRAALDTAAPVPGVDEPPGSAAPAPRRHPDRRSVVVGAGLAVLGAGAVAVGAAVLRPARPSARSLPVLTVSEEDRAELVRSLRSGGYAGIAAWLVTSPGVPAIARAKRIETLEGHGSGAGGMALHPERRVAGGGRATVLVVVEAEAVVGWRVDGLAAIDGGAITLHRLRGASGPLEPGALTYDTFPFEDTDRPSRLRIDVPRGVRWGAAVVFTE